MNEMKAKQKLTQTRYPEFNFYVPQDLKVLRRETPLGKKIPTVEVQLSIKKNKREDEFEVTTERSDDQCFMRCSMVNDSIGRLDQTQFSRSLERLPANTTMSVEDCDLVNTIRVNLKLSEPGSQVMRSSSCGQTLASKLLLHLDLSNQKLTIAPNIEQMLALQSIKLDCNQLQCLPLRIGNLQQLKVVSANKNQILDFPESLIRSKVEHIYLNQNLIERLPSKIGQVTHLKVLQLNQNPLTRLPRSFGQLQADVKFDWLQYLNSVEDIKYLCLQQNGDVLFVQALLFDRKYTKLHQLRQDKGLVHKMCKNGHLALLKTLQPGLVDWNCVIEQQTPLMVALNSKQTEVVKYLLKMPQLFNTHSSRFGSCIHIALRTNQMKTALVIYKKCMDPRLANVKDQDGNTPLHLLFSNFGPLREHDYSLKLAEVLYESSEDVNCYNKYMQTPVHVAVVFGNVKAIKFSLNRKKFDFNALGGERQQSLMHYAIEFTNIQIITALLSVMTDLRVTDVTGKSALDMVPYSSTIYKLIKQRTRANYVIKDFEDLKVQHAVISRRHSLTRPKIIQLPRCQQQDVPPSMLEDDVVDDVSQHVTSFDHCRPNQKPQASVLNKNSIILTSYESQRSYRPQAPLQCISTVMSLQYDSQPFDTRRCEFDKDQREYFANKALKAVYESNEFILNNNWDTQVSDVVDEPVSCQPKQVCEMLTMEQSIYQVQIYKFCTQLSQFNQQQLRQIYFEIIETQKLPTDVVVTCGQTLMCLHEVINCYLVQEMVRQKQQFQRQTQKQLDESFLDDEMSKLTEDRRHIFYDEMDYVSYNSNLRQTPKETNFKLHNF